MEYGGKSGCRKFSVFIRQYRHYQPMRTPVSSTLLKLAGKLNSHSPGGIKAKRPGKCVSY